MLRLRLVTSQGSPYPSRSPRAHPSGWTSSRTQGLACYFESTELHVKSVLSLGDGTGVGRGVGRGVGAGEGLGVGVTVGAGVGLGVGRGDGSAVGAGVGFGVGLSVGLGEGAGVVGATVGTDEMDGAADGTYDGAPVGTGVGGGRHQTPKQVAQFPSVWAQKDVGSATFSHRPYKSTCEHYVVPKARACGCGGTGRHKSSCPLSSEAKRVRGGPGAGPIPGA